MNKEIRKKGECRRKSKDKRTYVRRGEEQDMIKKSTYKENQKEKH